mmetsp:Transcript_74933/g.223278  ORF Transcript_74933/g.223278 Transcript_74933/m.223278 type:complete len:562 (-) Transcript_74933:64-1749(-)
MQVGGPAAGGKRPSHELPAPRSLPREDSEALLRCQALEASPSVPTPPGTACLSNLSEGEEAEQFARVEVALLRGKCGGYIFSAALPVTMLVAVALVYVNPLHNAHQVDRVHPCGPRLRSSPASKPCAEPISLAPPAETTVAPARGAQELAVEQKPRPWPPAQMQPLDDGEALGCAEYAVVYRPMDMNGQQLTVENSVAACQERCALTDDCAHYAYYLPSGHCHLQDAFAYATFNNLEWISGPSGCTMEERSPQIITVLMYKEVCYEADTGYYVLDMEDITPLWAHSVLECQRRCRHQPFCAHFTYNSISGICHLESAEALPVRNPRSGNIAGPPTCQIPKEKLLQISLQRAEAVCSKAGDDCSSSRCCSQPGMQCYERDSRWATCNATCTAGAEGGHGAAWSCTKLGPRSSDLSQTTQVAALAARPASTSRPRPAPRIMPKPTSVTTTSPPVRPRGACAGADDHAAWFGGGKAAFEVDMKECGAQCLGGEFCVSNCLAKRHGYTGHCSKCFGDATTCTVRSCLFQCMGGAMTPACRDCSKQHCRPHWENCTGFAAPRASEQ